MWQYISVLVDTVIGIQPCDNIFLFGLHRYRDTNMWQYMFDRFTSLKGYKHVAIYF